MKRNELLKKWFTEGFKSNKKAAEIREEGYKKETAGSHSSIRVSYQVNIKEHKELYEQAIEKVKQHKKR